ncbi:MAG: DUF6338 family protein [Alphaproteobacteria bacterium]|nr:DUF6338 family protein [Alphaproteobacteria bacterium]
MIEDILKEDNGSVLLFLYLLPGFLGSLIYDYLVEREKPSNFERIIDALVLTFVSVLIVLMIFKTGSFSKDAASDIVHFIGNGGILYVVLCAVSLSIIFAILNNHDVIYFCLNKVGLTYKNGGWDVWQDTFYKHRKYWVSVRYKDGRCLIGWPKFYSPTGKPRELFIADATWWRRDSSGKLISTDVLGAGVYICDFSNVEAIELLE